GSICWVFIAHGLDPDPGLVELSQLVSTMEVPAARVAAMAQGAHQGVVAELAPRAFLTLRQLLRATPTLLLGLDGIEDPHNLGAILRSAEAAGVDGVLLPERRSAPLSGAAVKASSGASELLQLCRVAGLASAVAEVRRGGGWGVAPPPPRGGPAPRLRPPPPPPLLALGAGRGRHRDLRWGGGGGGGGGSPAGAGGGGPAGPACRWQAGSPASTRPLPPRPCSTK